MPRTYPVPGKPLTSDMLEMYDLNNIDLTIPIFWQLGATGVPTTRLIIILYSFNKRRFIL